MRHTSGCSPSSKRRSTWNCGAPSACCSPRRRRRWISPGATPSHVRSTWPRVRPSRCRVPSRCSSIGSTWSTGSTSRPPAGPPPNGWPRPQRLAQATDEVTRCAAAVAEVDDAVVQHGELTERLARLSLDRAAALRRLELARTAAGAVATLTERVGQARTLADAVAAARAASVAAVEQRTALVADVDVRTKAIAELDAAVQHAVAEQVSSRAAADAAAAAAGAARAASEQGDSRVEAARAAVDADRATRGGRAAGRPGRQDRRGAQPPASTARRCSHRSRCRPRSMQGRRDGRRGGRAGAHAGSIGLGANGSHGGLGRCGGDCRGTGRARRRLHPLSSSQATTTAVEVPGVLTVRVVPGEPAADSQALLDAARRHLASLLDGAGVSDVAAARAVDERRRELTADRDRLRATCDALLGDDDVETLRAAPGEAAGRPSRRMRG